MTLNCQSAGSGAGQTQIRNRTVDFDVTDAPMSSEALRENDLMQFPTVMNSLVAIVNLDGVGDDEMRLTGEMLADIYLGKVTRWNDPRIAEMNPNLRLPSTAIAPVYRADGSGTTFVWVSYLSAVSPEFRQRVGVGTSVRFPVGTGARGNEGVAGTVRNARGTIGYVEDAYALQDRVTTKQIRNEAGNHDCATQEAFLTAARNADWSVPNFAADLSDTHGDQSWPIVSPTYILLPTNAERSRNAMRFFDAAWSRDVRADGRPVWQR